MSESSDLADDIVQDKLPEHIEVKRSDFAPWHKIRKQFIRQLQWNNLIARFFRRFLRSHLLSSAEDEPDTDGQYIRHVRCLIIPGEDLLDMRSLCTDLQSERMNCRIRYLGFNSSHGSHEVSTKLHIANNQVTAHSFVAKDSVVIHDQFQAITSKTSMASGYLTEYGPFHIVNLDLCDSLFPTASNDMAEYYNALYRLIEFQLHNQNTPWLLFITTEVAPQEVDAEVLAKFCIPTRNNCKNASFAQRLGQVLPADTFPPDSDNISSSLTEEELVRLFGVAMGKTLLSLAKTSNPQWKVKMLRSHRYPIKEEHHVHMLSLAYLFEPVLGAPMDATGIATVQGKSAVPIDECELGLRIIAGVENISDVVEALRRSPQLHGDLMQSAADLMEEAGYDREEYLRWVASYDAN